MKIVDAHLHLWSPSTHDWYPALPQFADRTGTPALAQDYGIDEHRRDAGPDFVVDKFVHVSATTRPRAYLDETRWVSDLADEHELDLVVIGSVDPLLAPDEIVADLEAQAVATPRFRGVRVLYDLVPDSAAAGTVLRWLDERGLVFDLAATPETMATWLDSVARFPDLTVVLEYTGWPTSTSPDGRAAWERALASYAEWTPGLCKLSGLGMTTLGLSEPTLRPWLETAIEVLGWDRIAFGSNMPIELMAGTYAQLIATLRSVVASGTPEQQQAFWAGNAEAAYRV